MTRSRMRIGGVLFLTLALLAGACGGDDDDTDASAGEDTEETPNEEENSGGEEETSGGEEGATGGDVDPADIKTDFGADDETIRLGLLTDLSGPFSVLAKDIAVAQEVYWEKVNEEGGIGGRMIEVVTVDEKYDPATHKQKFQAMKAQDANGVLMMTQSIGSPHTAAIKEELVEEHMIAIPLTWYSGWADPAFGKNVFEAYTNYCFESINSLQYMFDKEGVKTVAIVSFPGEYGQDGAKGAKLAAEKLGMEVVYDGEGKVTPPSPTSPNPDNSGIVTSIVDSEADLVWTTINPATLAVMMGQATAKGFKGKWSGNAPSYSPNLLKSDIKSILDSSYYQPTYTVALGTDVPGMQPMIDAIKASKPDALASDYYVYGWTEAQITEAILRQAVENGDLTREGVEKAAFELDKVDFGGLAPDQTWKGDPDEYIVRESYMFKPRVDLYSEGPIGTGTTGSELLEGPFSSPITDEYDYGTLGACYKP